MESAMPSSSAPPYSGGAGGKFRKPPVSRRRPSTPYDRPPSLTTGNTKSDDSQGGGGGWLSKLVVNPARRLIVGGATRLLPSFFSKSDSSSADEFEDDPPGDQDNEDIDATVNACSDGKHTLELGVSRWSGDAGPSNEMNKLKGSSEQHNDARLDKSKNSIDDLGLDKIENMLKGKQFSRDESNRLMEILNSRLADVSSAEREKKAPDVISHGQAKEGMLDGEIPSTLTMGKQYDLERAVLETPMRRLQSNMREEVAASPIDIARAYMGSRTPEQGFNTYSTISKDGREQQPSNLFPSKPHILTPSSKSPSTCWPGAMVQDQRGFLTPQRQRARYGLHNFPRTPYSRTVYSRTKPKVNQLQDDSRSSNISLTTFQQSRTPNYRQMKPSGDVMDGGYGSVGPIRRVRNKFASEPDLEGPSSLFSAQAPSSGASRSFMPVFQKNPETSGTSGNSNVNTVDRHEQTFKGEATPAGPSNETVRKILEQLDRHKPTPKEKAAELKLATEWKRSPSQDTTLMPKGSTILAALTGPDLQKSGVSSDNGSSFKGMNGGVSFKGIPDPTKTSDAATKISSTVYDAGAGPSFGFKNMGGADEKSTVTTTKEKEKSQPWSVNNQINGVDTARKRPSQPILQPISFKRPDPQQVVSADNGRGFTFPFSATAGSAAEPPTPSIMPSFPSTQSKELPTYSFGTKKSASERVVFSFPSTSNAASIDEGESDLKFKFGSDKKKRVSFSSIGSDGIFIN